MGSGDPDCTLHESTSTEAGPIRRLVTEMDDPAPIPNRHNFEADVGRLNNAITKISKEA